MRRPGELRPRAPGSASLLALLLCLAGCQPAATARDWAASPAVVELEAPGALYAVSDVHGAYDRLVALLARHGLIAAPPVAPGAVEWSGGDATLVVAGDLFDKGPAGLPVIDLLRALQASAAPAGGRVVVLLGNHEAEFLADPINDKANADDGIAKELRAAGLDPRAVARGAEPRGRWLRALPFAARVGAWLFSHAGDTGGRTVAELESQLRAAVDGRGFGDAAIIGERSILASEGWFAGDRTLAARYAQAAGAAHLVFGHDPGALGSKGIIAETQGGALLRIDCGMSPLVGYSAGALLRVTREGGREVAAALDADGAVRELWKD